MLLVGGHQQLDNRKGRALNTWELPGKEKGRMVLPDAFQEMEDGRISEAIEMGGDIILLAVALEKERWAQIEELTKESIESHRDTLEALAR